MKAPIASPQQIAAALNSVSQEYQVPEQTILSHCKQSAHSEARMWFWFILCMSDGVSPKSLARLSGHNHSSVYHACKKAVSWMRIYPVLRQRYDRIVTAYNLALA